MRRLAFVASFLFVIAVAPRARADKTRDCVDAYESSQVERKDRHLVTAREKLLVCAQDACPAIVKKDCVPWLAEVEQALPSVVVYAKDSAGKDLADVKVSLDGAPFSASIDGTSRPIDPGKHVFRFERSGKSLEETFVIGEGQKHRPVGVTFDADKPLIAPAKDAPPPPPVERDKPSLLPAYGLAALGTVAIGSAIFFGATAKSDAEDLRNRCAPRCTDDDVGGVETKLLLSDIALGVGIVSLGVAAYMLLRSPSAPPSAAKIRYLGPGVSGAF